MQEFATYARVRNLCKSSQLMQEFATYARVRNLCKSSQLMQEFATILRFNMLRQRECPPYSTVTDLARLRG
jgi:hypothetical protein